MHIQDTDKGDLKHRLAKAERELGKVRDACLALARRLEAAREPPPK